MLCNVFLQAFYPALKQQLIQASVFSVVLVLMSPIKTPCCSSPAPVDRRERRRLLPASHASRANPSGETVAPTTSTRGVHRNTLEKSQNTWGILAVAHDGLPLRAREWISLLCSSTRATKREIEWTSGCHLRSMASTANKVANVAE